MKKPFPLKRFRDVSIAKKLYFTVGIMALLIGIELFALFFSLNTLSSVRAYVGGEGLWSKAQKDAFFHLYRYGMNRNEQDYDKFNRFMTVVLGDGKARREMTKKNPDMAVVRQGFLEGKNHPDDISGMITLFARFNNVSYIHKAIVIWGKAENMAMKLVPIGNALHAEIKAPVPSQARIDSLLKLIDPLGEKITSLEDAFSYTLGAGSRWLEGLVQKLLFIIALTVEITGLTITIIVSRNIQKGLNEIIHASRQFAAGEHQSRARVFSQDEIGVLARSFNEMSDKLAQGFAELEQAQKKFRDLLDAAPDPMIILDAQGHTSLANAEAEKLFGYSRQELGSIPLNLIMTKKGEWATIETLLAETRGKKADFSGRHRNGHEFPIEVTSSPIMTEEGLLTSVAVRDMSDRQYIRELERKNSELEQFAYIASHDLQEPLGTISSFIMLMEMEQKHSPTMDPETLSYIGYIKQSAERLKALITGLLEYSRIGQKSQLGRVDCALLMKEVINDMRAAINESQAQVDVEALPVVPGYEVELRLLFQNLLSNAIKYRQRDQNPHIHVSSVKENGHWRFCVADNGIGIDEKYRDKVFVIFQRLHNQGTYKGTGIGLAHCKKIIDLHNGHIWLESVPLQGSKFYFTIPDNT